MLCCVALPVVSCCVMLCLMLLCCCPSLLCPFPPSLFSASPLCRRLASLWSPSRLPTPPTSTLASTWWSLWQQHRQTGGTGQRRQQHGSGPADACRYEGGKEGVRGEREARASVVFCCPACESLQVMTKTCSKRPAGQFYHLLLWSTAVVGAADATAVYCSVALSPASAAVQPGPAAAALRRQQQPQQACCTARAASAAAGCKAGGDAACATLGCRWVSPKGLCGGGVVLCRVTQARFCHISGCIWQQLEWLQGCVGQHCKGVESQYVLQVMLRLAIAFSAGCFIAPRPCLVMCLCCRCPQEPGHHHQSGHGARGQV